MTDPLGVSKMTTTATDFQGRKPAIGKRRAGIAGLIALLGFSFANLAQAENVLEDLTYTAQPGGRVRSLAGRRRLTLDGDQGQAVAAKGRSGAWASSTSSGTSSTCWL